MKNVELVHIPINAGQREDIDERLMPDGLFSEVRNMRLRKSGALGVRYGFDATPNVVYDGSSVTMYDISDYGGDLVAFGTTNGRSSPEFICTYSDGGWSPEAPGVYAPRRFGLIDSVEEYFTYPDVGGNPTGSTTILVASTNGYVCVARSSRVIGLLSAQVWILEESTGRVIHSEHVGGSVSADAIASAKLIAVGNTFVLLGRNHLLDNLNVLTFDTESDTAFSAGATIHSSPLVGFFDAAPVSSTQFVTFSSTPGGSVGLVQLWNINPVTLAGYCLPTAGTNKEQLSVCVTPDEDVVLTYTDMSSTADLYVDTIPLSELVPSGGTQSTSQTLVVTGSGAISRSSVVATGDDEVIVTGYDSTDRLIHCSFRVGSTLADVDTFEYTEAAPIARPFAVEGGKSVLMPITREGDALTRGVMLVDLRSIYGLEMFHYRGEAFVGSVANNRAAESGSNPGVFYLPTLGASDDDPRGIILKLGVSRPVRRQTVTAGGLMYVTGGFLGVWDGTRCVESGFADTPSILSLTPSVSTGLLTALATYSYSATFTWVDSKGNLHVSPPSSPISITLSGSEDTVTAEVAYPQTIRRDPSTTLLYSAATVNLFRTLPSPENIFLRDDSFKASGSPAGTVDVISLTSDADLADNQILYTQGARGAISGPLEHNAPRPCKFACVSRDRLLIAGLPNEREWQQSKKFFPGEPVQFSEGVAYRGQVNGTITAVSSQDDQEYVFTDDQVYVISGEGPDDLGNGEFNSPRAIPGNSLGCIDWRSIARTDKGVWFQAKPSRLCLLPRGGGAPKWEGEPVRDTLENYPVIKGAAVVPHDNTTCWAATNSADNESRIVVYDDRAEDWYIDTDVVSSGTIDALAEYQGRLAILNSGRVYLQRESITPTDFIDHQFTTGSIAPFGSNGYGKLVSVTLSGSYRGSCVVTCSVSYDDGATFSAVGSGHSVTGLSAGAPVELQWFPSRRKGSRFQLRFAISQYESEDTAACDWSSITLELQPSSGARRLPGSLRR